MTTPSPREPDAREALRELVERIDAIHSDPQFKSVWMVNQLHAGPYRGPTYVEELKKARAALLQPAALGGMRLVEAERVQNINKQLDLNALKAAWTALQHTPIDLLADSDDETCRCVHNAIAAYLVALPSPPPSDERAKVVEKIIRLALSDGEYIGRVEKEGLPPADLIELRERVTSERLATLREALAVPDERGKVIEEASGALGEAKELLLAAFNARSPAHKSKINSAMHRLKAVERALYPLSTPPTAATAEKGR